MAALTNNMTTIPLNAEDTALLKSVAAHEGGHCVTAAYFKLNPRAFIGGPRSGIVAHRAGTSLENAAVAFAGVISEDMLKARCPGRTLPKIELTPETFARWSSDMIFNGGLEDFARHGGASDVRMVEAEPRKCESAWLAFQILTLRRDQLEWWADLLADKSWRRFREAQIRNRPDLDEIECVNRFR